MQAISDIPQSARRKVYRVAGQSIVVEPQDSWSAAAIEKLFAGWYLFADGAIEHGALDQRQVGQSIVIRSTVSPPQIPRAWPQFKIAGGGVCFTDGGASYIDIEGSIIAIGAPDLAAVEVWVDGPMDLLSPKLTRIVTYALAGVLRRRGLFELHSGAMVEPVSGNGVLIIGPSGSGKSTLTVQLAAAAWPFLTDDVLVLDHEQSQVRAWPMRRCFAITSETFATSSFLQSRTSIENLRAQTDDKKQFVPHDVFATEFRENCVPTSLFFSQISGEPSSRVSALSAGETMTRLIRMNPWSCYDQTTAANHLAVLSALVKQARGYALFAGTDLLNPENAARLITKHVCD